MKKIALFILILGALSVIGCKNEAKQAAPTFGKTGNADIDALTEQIFKNPKEAQLYYKRAQLLAKDGQNGGYDFAITDMEYALTLDSTNIDYHHFLADVYLDYSQSRLAMNTLERCYALHPESIPTALKLAETSIILKLYNRALEVIDKVFQKDPQNAYGYFLTGVLFKEQNDFARASSAFQKSVDIDPSNIDGFLELGRLFTSKKSPLAVKYFDNALLIDSLSREAALGKAYYYQEMNELPKAVEVYKSLIARDRTFAEAYFNLGLVYMDMKDYPKALEHFDITIKEKPTHFKAYFYRGYVYEVQGNKEAALTNYKQSLEFNSTFAKALEGVERLSKQ